MDSTNDQIAKLRSLLDAADRTARQEADAVACSSPRDRNGSTPGSRLCRRARGADIGLAGDAGLSTDG
jgi:hypothetical protein